MAKLQPCPKCGAQFDVSAFASGTKFTCGACGAVVTAGAAAAPAPVASRVPPAPSRTPPAPVAAAQVAGRRGPQYQPPERHQSPAPAGRGASERREREPRRGERHHEGPPKRGISPVVMTGIGAAVLAVAVGAFLMMKKDDPSKGKNPTVDGQGNNSAKMPNPSGGNTASQGNNSAVTSPGGVGGMGNDSAPAGGEALAAIESDWTKKSAHSRDDLVKFFGRYKATGAAGTQRTKAVAEEIVKLADPNFKPAREYLGFKEFAYEVPDGIAFRKYPYIRAVEEASRQRWFDDDESYQLAMKAWEKTKAHEAKILADSDDGRMFRALDEARRAIDFDKDFKAYNYEAIFASPYLICYSSTERMTEEELGTLPKKERQQKLAELEKNREQYRQILAEKAKIYQQLYGEFMKRYADDCELKDLMAEFGGRGDYPPSKRSFRDGCALIIWIFSDRQAFDDYHENVKKESIDKGVAGYFSPITGWVYLYDEGNNRTFEINKNVHEGTHQLEHWFSRQKKEWGLVRRPQSFFGEGFAEYLGAVNMAKDRTLTFHGVNVPRLEFLKHMRQQLKAAGKPLLVFPAKDLVGFEGYPSVDAWALKNWGQPGLGVFYAQSWAFVYFLNQHQNGKYKKNFTRFLDAMLVHPRDEAGHGYTFAQFKKAMDIRSEDDWKKLDKEFGEFYSKLIDMDLSKVNLSPPARDDWPGYEPIDPVNPTSGTPAAAGAPSGAPAKGDTKEPGMGDAKEPGMDAKVIERK